MSFLGSIGNFLKNPIQPITHAIGKTVGITANTNNGIHIDPTKLALTAGALALPGVGSLIGKGIGELGGLAGAIPGAGAVEGALGSLGGAAKAIPGVSAIGKLLGGSDNSGAGAGYDPATGQMSGGQSSGTSGGLVNSIEGLLGLGGGASSGTSGGNSGGLLQSIEGLITGNGGLNALGIAQGVNAASLGKQSSDYAKDALGSATSAYNDKAPLRTAGQAGLLNPQVQDLSGLTASRNGLNTSVPAAPATGTANPQALQSIAALLNPSATQNKLGSIASANPFGRAA